MDDTREWLEADGLGGFASGTVGLVRTRRYHALLLTATTPPTGRVVLVNGFDAWVDFGDQRIPISAQQYQPGITFPDGRGGIEAFARDPWPTWTFRLDPVTTLRQEILVPRGTSRTIVTWTLEGAGTTPVRLVVRPFLSGRDYHATHHENAVLNVDPHIVGDSVTWRPYPGVPAVVSRTNGQYAHASDWYRRFHYAAETARGLDDTEDLWSPGWLTWDLTRGEAVWILEAEGTVTDAEPAAAASRRHRETERARRHAFTTPVHRAADDYLVARGDGRTLIAGYPWFTDWGRDTFIALRGLCLATGRFDAALGILREWADTVSEGMLPNRFPDGGSAPEYNSVDASLWFTVAVRDLLDATAGSATVRARDRVRLMDAVTAILEGYSRGTRFGIRADDDGLLACGEPGVQLTWMDARVGDEVITPRIGKPVEVQALWLAALAFGARVDPKWKLGYLRGHLAFSQRFWNEARHCLFDVVDVDHRVGRVDDAVRPNQILAVGGLGSSLLDLPRARAVVDIVERDLLIPCGLRSLAPGSAGFVPHYEGGPSARDRAYHQGTAWPWLLGPFVDAWLAVREPGPGVVREARQRFVGPLLRHLDDAGLGHVSEILDAEAPFTPRGCPFQAWSLGELIRLTAALDAAESGQPAVTGRERPATVAESV